jgi:hypothetical protein
LRAMEMVFPVSWDSRSIAAEAPESKSMYWRLLNVGWCKNLAVFE